MAVYTVANGGGNINAGATYVGGIAPSSTDTIDFTATSGQLTVNINFIIAGIDFTNYANTLTINASLISTGNVTLSSTMTITTTSGVPLLRIDASVTLTSNGKIFPYDLTINSGISSTITLADNWTVLGTVTNSASLVTINGNTLNCSGSVTWSQQNSGGTTLFVLNGTGTFTAAGTFKNNLTINTAGTITISGTVSYSTGTLTYTAGTVVTTSSTLSITATSTLNTDGIIWNNFSNFANTPVTLTSDLYCTGTFRTQTAAGTLNGFNIYCSGNLLTDSGNASGGTTNIILTGTGTWTGIGSNTLRNNLTIKSTASIIISGNIAYNTGTFIVEAGAQVNASNSSLTVQATATTTFDISTIKLNNFYLGGASTVNTLQLNSPLYITGTAFLGASSQGQTINGSPVYIENGTLTSGGGNQGAVLGTSQIIANGDKFTYLDNSVPVFLTGVTWRLPITINVKGTILMYGRLVISTGGSFNIQNGTVDHRDGLVNRTSLIIQANTTLTNIDKCKFKNITVTAGVTITMNKFFTGSPEFKSVIRSNGATNYNITFTDGVPKKAYFVNVKNCTITQTLVKNQLNIIGRDSNAGFNTGIIFGEAGLNGFPLNQYVTENSYSFTDGFSQGGLNN